MTGPALSREIVAMIADRADWLVDAVACSTQNRMFLRGEKECDAEACGSILLNGKQAITQVAQAQAAELERLRAALTECMTELDGYYRNEYPSDHPLHVRNREFAFASNPARIALEAKP